MSPRQAIAITNVFVRYDDDIGFMLRYLALMALLQQCWVVDMNANCGIFGWPNVFSLALLEEQ